MFFGPKCGEFFSKKNNWRYFQKNRGIMLPHNKYYSLFTFNFWHFGEISHPQKEDAALLYTFIDETSTPNMLPRIYPCTCHPAIIQKWRTRCHPQVVKWLPTYVVSSSLVDSRDFVITLRSDFDFLPFFLFGGEDEKERPHGA
jgi:hypothetical protein